MNQSDQYYFVFNFLHQLSEYQIFG